MTTYTYELTYIDGATEEVSYKLHRGAQPHLLTNRGSYYVSFYYPIETVFGKIIYTGHDLDVNGVLRIKQIKK